MFERFGRPSEFAYLWTASAVSSLGNQVTVLVLPIIAAVVLGASPVQMGVLSACATISPLIVGLPAGVLIDRWRRRRQLMITCDVTRAVILATIPVAYWLGALSLYQLFALALLIGTCNLFFDVSSQTLLPRIVPDRRLLAANSRLQTTEAASRMIGPGMGGFLVGIVAAPWVIVIDVVSFVLSALLLGGVSEDGPAAPSARTTRLRDEVREGLRFVVGHPLVSRITATTATVNLAYSARNALLVIFVLRELQVDVPLLGIILSTGAVGGLAGAVTAHWFSNRVGRARVIPLSAVALAAFAAFTPLAGLAPVSLLIVSTAGTSWAVVVYNVAQLTLRQRACPPHLLGRMNASIAFVIYGSQPLGALVGGFLGEVVSLTTVMWLCVVLFAIAAAPVALSPLRHDTADIEREVTKGE